ncbi:MAG: response regulator [Gemmatimonadaceae bacterium]|nr:response regulator [Gemmatimonadaceae bacterium]
MSQATPPSPDAARIPRWQSVRTRIGFLAVAVAVPLTLGFALRAWQRNGVERERQQARAAELVGLVVHGLDSEVDAVEAQLRTIARILPAPPGDGTADARLDSLLDAALADAHLPWTDLVLADSAGRLVGAAHRDRHAPRATAIRDRPGFGTAAATGAWTVGDVIRSVADVDTSRVLTFFLPVRTRSGARTVLAAALPVDSLDGLQVARALPPGSVVTVMDTTGTVVLRTLDPEHWIGRRFGSAPGVRQNLVKRRGVDASRSADGTVRLSGFDRMRTTGWLAYVGIPARYTLDVARAQFLNDLALGATITLLVLLIAWRLALRIVGPIESLTTDARAIAAGDEARRSAIRSPDEIGVLAAAVNQMADTAVARRQALLASQDQLRQSQKMEALGSFAGGIAHDFNNYLAAIGGYAELAASDLEEGTRARADVDEVLHATRRASDLTRQILSFSRRQVVQPEVLDPADVLHDVARLLGPILGETIETALVLEHGDARILVDRGQLEQLLVNLATNARDAMPDGGRFVLASRTTTLDAAQGARRALGSGEWVVLTVRDTGQGIPPAVRARLFEPFFTTKPRGRGTGLGLALAWSTMQQAGGTIAVDSAPGQGSTFDLWFPRAVAEITGTAASAPMIGAATVPAGDERVLVVEDDASVRAMTSALLRRAGYKVRTAEDAAMALAMLEVPGAQYDLLVSDVVMPGMHGATLARRVQALHPGFPVLLMSGYADDEQLVAAVRAPGVAFLAKPFTGDALLSSVRTLLDGARGDGARAGAGSVARSHASSASS